MIPAVNSIGPAMWPELAKSLSDEALEEAISIYADLEYFELCAVLQKEREKRMITAPTTIQPATRL